MVQPDLVPFLEVNIWKPTPKADWVKAGERVVSSAGMYGVVLRIVTLHSLPAARVKWDNCFEGSV
jgi:hypothetical protein